MKIFQKIVYLCAFVSVISFAERIYLQGGRAGGYDTVQCPRGYRLESCSFNHNTCDNTSWGANSCSADSRDNRPCNFTAVCVSEVREVMIRGGRAGGYDEARCPAGYQIDYCDFDNFSCDGQRQGYNYCGADSRNNRLCQFTGRCVSRN